MGKRESRLPVAREFPVIVVSNGHQLRAYQAEGNVIEAPVRTAV
jgi:hypothetical protein